MKIEMKTVSDYAEAYCDFLIDEENININELHQDNECDDIPSDDYSEMRRNGIECDSDREYWEAFNAHLAGRISKEQEVQTQTIAQQLKNSSVDWDTFFASAEKQSVSKDQDWDAGATVFEFADGSELIVTDEIEVTK